MKLLILLFCGLLPALGLAQPYGMDWHKISGGGGTGASTNRQYALRGTIGQTDAGGVMTNGQYGLTGGFWSLLNVIQTAGAPRLAIQFNAPLATATVSWPTTDGFTLQQSSDLAAGWVASGYTITTTNGTSSITISGPTGRLFFRLQH